VKNNGKENRINTEGQGAEGRRGGERGARGEGTGSAKDERRREPSLSLVLDAACERGARGRRWKESAGDLKA